MITNGNTTRTRVKNTLKIALLALFLIAAAGAMAQQPAAATASSQAQKVEAFLRYYFALGPEVEITVATPTELGTSGILEVPIEVKSKEGSDKLKMYLTKDGRYLLRGEISDLTIDPLAENIAKMQTRQCPRPRRSQSPHHARRVFRLRMPGLPQLPRRPPRPPAQLPPGQGHLQGLSHRCDPPLGAYRRPGRALRLPSEPQGLLEDL